MDGVRCMVVIDFDFVECVVVIDIPKPIITPFFPPFCTCSSTTLSIPILTSSGSLPTPGTSTIPSPSPTFPSTPSRRWSSMCFIMARLISGSKSSGVSNRVPSESNINIPVNTMTTSMKAAVIKRVRRGGGIVVIGIWMSEVDGYISRDLNSSQLDRQCCVDVR